MKRIGKVAAVALTTAVAGLVIPLATASSASADVRHCPADAFCVWMHNDFQGDKLIPSSAGGGWRDFSTRAFDNITSSARNNTSRTWCLYEHPDYQGALMAVFPPNTQLADLGVWNDKASSARVC